MAYRVVVFFGRYVCKVCSEPTVLHKEVAPKKSYRYKLCERCYREIVDSIWIAEMGTDMDQFIKDMIMIKQVIRETGD